MDSKIIEQVIEDKTEKVLSQLEWHDTLDVQSAVKKAFSLGFLDGLEYFKTLTTETKDEEIEVKPKKKVNRSGKKK